MTGRYSPGCEPVPGFVLNEFLGRGGFGHVWKASAPGGTEVALKIINLGRREGLRELRALRMFRRVRHPHLVPITGFWLLDSLGRPLDPPSEEESLKRLAADPRATATTALRPAELVIVMGLGDLSLQDRLRQCLEQGLPGIPPHELLSHIDDAARAIDYLNSPRHDLGSGPSAIQHCDIKPQNLVIVGNSCQVCDFGLARVLGDVRRTVTAMSVAYAAPELLEANAPSQSTDQYSLAVTYVELRTGSLPFADDSTAEAVTAAHLRGQLDLSRLPRPERRVIRRATALAPEERFPSAAALAQALVEAVRRDASPPLLPEAVPVYYSPIDVPDSRVLLPRGRAASRRIAWWLTAALVAAAASAGWYFRDSLAAAWKELERHTTAAAPNAQPAEADQVPLDDAAEPTAAYAGNSEPPLAADETVASTADSQPLAESDPPPNSDEAAVPDEFVPEPLPEIDTPIPPPLERAHFAAWADAAAQLAALVAFRAQEACERTSTAWDAASSRCEALAGVAANATLGFAGALARSVADDRPSRALAWLDRGDPSAALDELTAAIESGLCEPEVFRRRAAALVLLRQFDRALEDLRQAWPTDAATKPQLRLRVRVVKAPLALDGTLIGLVLEDDIVRVEDVVDGQLWVVDVETPDAPRGSGKHGWLEAGKVEPFEWDREGFAGITAWDRPWPSPDAGETANLAGNAGNPGN